MSIGYALSGSSPSPAVRLVPTNRIDFFAFAGVREVARAALSALGNPPPVDCVVSCTDAALSALALLDEHAVPNAVAVANTIAAVTNQRLTRISPFMLVARNLTKEYRSGDNRLAVLRDVSFSIPQAALVAIVVPSGS